MMNPTKTTIALCLFLGCMTGGSEAFTTSQPAGPRRCGMTALNAAEDEAMTTSRRGFLTSGIVAGIAAAGPGLFGNPEEASARYSSYANREKDWADRTEKGEINYKTARDLRAELREIAPMNTPKSKIFCPNGPSAAVSPLMENKCSDQLALPSVYGRTQDTVGNSIPGFKEGSLSLNLDGAGGFPTYSLSNNSK